MRIMNMHTIIAVLMSMNTNMRIHRKNRAAQPKSSTATV